jgi:Protein of unknown function (DUF3011)
MHHRIMFVTTLCATVAMIAVAPQVQAEVNRTESRTVTCESYDGRFSQCQIPERSQVRIVEQLSAAPCYQSRTWGVGDGYIWVNDGCRARFEVTSGYGRDGGYGLPGGYGDRGGYGSASGPWYDNEPLRRAELGRAEFRRMQYACSERARDHDFRVKRSGDSWWTRRGLLRTEMWVQRHGDKRRVSCFYDPRREVARLDWRY